MGGSSGGEGCVLTAAASVVGVGSDVGGSIRMPAFFCGIYGHKETNEAVSAKSRILTQIWFNFKFQCCAQG